MPESIANTLVLRIVYVITDLEVGGVPFHLLRMARCVRDAGHDVAVVSLKSPGPVAAMLRSDEIRVQSCFARSNADWRVFDRLAEILADAAPDIVHSLLFHANQAARIAALLSGFPRRRLICELQTVEVERTWHLWVDRWMHRLCAMTIGNSPSVIEHLHRRAGIPMARLHCIPGAVDVQRIAAAAPMDRAELSVSDDDVLILWVGRLDPIKGLDTLIAAVDALRRKQPVRLLLAGDGPLRAQIESDIARRNLEDFVTLLGRRDDVPRLLKTADLFVFPSRTEGMPNALLEAMAAGLPVITTDVPGCRDVVAHGHTGVLVPVDHVDALVRAILGALDRPKESSRMSGNACHYINECHNVARCVAEYLAVYRRVRHGAMDSANI